MFTFIYNPVSLVAAIILQRRKLRPLGLGYLQEVTWL